MLAEAGCNFNQVDGENRIPTVTLEQRLQGPCGALAFWAEGTVSAKAQGRGVLCSGRRREPTVVGGNKGGTVEGGEVRGEIGERQVM